MFTDVPDEILKNLDPKSGVELVESIVHADARASKIPHTSISFPHNVNAADGGVDGRVKGAKQNSVQETIKEGLTCYQIKTGNFSPTPTNMGRMLLNKKALKPGIQECFDLGGTLVLVLIGCDSPSAEKRARENIKKKLGKKHEDAKIEIWTMSTLRGFLAGNPCLRLQVLGIDDGSFRLYEEWRRQDDMDNTLNLGPEQSKFIDTVQCYL